jgi:hypothetical protein
MYFMKIIHGVYLKDLSLRDLLPHILILVLYFSVLFSAGIWVFKKREG